MLAELQSSIQEAGPESFSVAAMGTTADQLVYTALKQTPLRTLMPSTPVPSKPAAAAEGSASSPNKPKLAIIGMSGRFPSVLPVMRSEERDIGVFPPTAVQLASVCLQMALCKTWASWNVAPSAVVGHSLGEYAALNAAGVLSDADTIYLVGKGADLLQEKCTRDTHAMLVVKGSVDDMAGALRGVEYETACINSPVETVLAGSNEHVAKLMRLLVDSGKKCTLLKVPYAFHSSQIDPILDDFRRIARGVTFSKAKMPILCPLNGDVVTAGNGDFGPDYLARHSRAPVNMLKALEAARSSNMATDQTTMLEIGPHPAVSGMVRAVLGPQVGNLCSLQRGRSVWPVLGGAVKSLYTAGADIRWAEYDRDLRIRHELQRRDGPGQGGLYEPRMGLVPDLRAAGL